MSLSASAIVVLRRSATTFILKALASMAVALHTTAPHSAA
jgi:hypothetical protein